MKVNKCCQKYSKDDVKKLLEFNEGHGQAAGPDTMREVVHTLHGPLNITMRSSKASGHAKERHLLISETGLEDRTIGEGDADGLPMASAFLSAKYDNLILCLRQLLNSKKGQLALSYLDMYRDRGKTRVVISESSAKLGCPHIKARVLYKGKEESITENISAITAVIDSNLGGELPLRIVTCFPSKEGASVSVGLPSALQESRDCTAEVEKAVNVENSWASSTSQELQFADKAIKWLVKGRNSIPDDLKPVKGAYAVSIGERFNDAWFRPNPSFYKYRYPLSKTSGQGEPLAYSLLEGDGAAKTIVPKMLHYSLVKNVFANKGIDIKYYNDMLLYRL